jgi:SAM-dependent methyltransferase
LRREFANWVRINLIDYLLPPVVRDWRPLNKVAKRWWTGEVPLDFQKEAWDYTPQQWSWIWDEVANSRAGRRHYRYADSSTGQIAWLCGRVRELQPEITLDVGAGGGIVASHVLRAKPAGAQLHVVEPYSELELPTADSDKLVTQLRASADSLPFDDQQVDLIICAHTLEHLTNMVSTFRELQRVARRLLIIVPLQRWSPYTWDTHLHFFPYLEYLPGLLEVPAKQARVVDGDACYEFAGKGL